MSRSRRTISLVMLGLILGTGSACARARGASPVAPVAESERPWVGELRKGTLIRYGITGAEGDTHFDRVERASADTLWLASRRVIPVARLSRLEASLSGGLSGRALAWSTGIGAGAGALLGALVPPDTTSLHRPHARGETAALGALVGFLVGTITWIVVTPSERWTPVSLVETR